MTLRTRVYLVLALVALLALGGAAVTLTSGLTSAGGSDPTPAAQTCDQQDDADDAAEGATKEADTDDVEEECGDENEGDDANEGEDDDVQAPSGTLDDGKDLLPDAGISVDRAIAFAKSAASGPVGEVDLEQYQGKLVFNVDVGDKDVKVDAANGSILAVDADD